MPKVKQLSRPIDPHIIATLETMLEWAKDGRMIGLVAFVNLPGNEFQTASAGDMATGDVMMAYESWKFDQLYQAHKAGK